MANDDRAYVPNGESRHDTAVLLVGTAEEFGIDVRLIKSDHLHKGFYIPQSLADVLYDEPKKPARRATKKASGNRAAKKSSTDKD